jgi:HK97 gp10 family phage protein
MADVTVEIKNLDKLQNALRNYEGIARPILQRAMAATNAIFAQNTKKGDPVPWRTGLLATTFFHKLGNLEARWQPTRKYAVFVEYGTRKMRAQPYMGQILQKSKRDIEQIFENALEDITNKIAD